MAKSDSGYFKTKQKMFRLPLSSGKGGKALMALPLRPYPPPVNTPFKIFMLDIHAAIG